MMIITVNHNTENYNPTTSTIDYNNNNDLNILWVLIHVPEGTCPDIGDHICMLLLFLLQRVNLTFGFPFYGHTVNHLFLATSGQL